VTLVSYAVTQSAYEKIIPKFVEEWQQKTGQKVTFEQSYGGSGSQTRAVIDGLEADVVALALALDTKKIEQAGLIQPGWEKEAPNDSIVHKSVVAFVPRDANIKINKWSDLAKDNIKVITANPKTSGGARWNFLALWGSVTQAEGSDQKGENLAYTVPTDYNISIDNPVAVVDANVDKKGTRKVAEAFVQFLFTPEAQREFAKVGFRPVEPTIVKEFESKFPQIKNLFTVQDLGGWDKVQKQFFEDGALFDKILTKAGKS